MAHSSAARWRRRRRRPPHPARRPGESGRSCRFRPCVRDGSLLPVARHRLAARADVRELHGLVGAGPAHEHRAVSALVTGNTYRHPTLLAKTITALDHVSGGRATLGIGAGWFELEHDSLGYEFGTFTDRFEKLEEALQIIVPMLRGETVTHDGKHYQVTDAINSPAPLSRIPIMIGGSGEKKTLRMVAQYADESNLSSGAIDEIPRKLDALAAHCDRLGRDRSEIKVTKLQMVLVAPTMEEAEADLRAMRRALSEQLNHEFGSAYLYLAMSAYCSHADFNGAAQWFKLQYEEEHLHATRVYNYLIEQGVEVALTEIGAPPSGFGSLLGVFEASLTHEREMTARLNDLSDQALHEKDHATYNLLQWFVNEQVEEEATIGGIIAKLRLVNDDGYGLLMIDNELGARTAPTPP